MEKKSTSPEVKGRILETARSLFVQNGYTGTSIRDIASASNANVAHVKYYFESKSNLFEIIFDEAFEILYHRVSVTITSDLPFFEMVETWVNIYFEILPEYPQISIFILNEIDRSPQGLIERVSKHDPFNVFEKLEEKMKKEIEKGTIKNIPTLDFGLNLISLCVFPFVLRRVAMRVAKKADDDYDKMLEGHRKYVLDCLFSCLKP